MVHKNTGKLSVTLYKTQTMFRNQIYVQSTTCVVMYVFYFFACAFYHIYFQKVKSVFYKSNPALFFVLFRR